MRSYNIANKLLRNVRDFMEKSVVVGTRLKVIEVQEEHAGGRGGKAKSMFGGDRSSPIQVGGEESK